MKSKIGIIITALAVAFLVGCASANKVAYQTIGSLEASVANANAAYLDAVVSGQAATNSVPVIEAEFNATQIALHAAAVLASTGTNAVASAQLQSQAQTFISHATPTK